MPSRKFLLIPGNNSLSHVAKCIAITEALLKRGHQVRMAVSKKHSDFVDRLSIEHSVLPDIQEQDDSGFPSVEWFRNPENIINCIRSEVALLNQYRPDRVLGVFRFTLKASAKIAGIPYDSLICGCMIPDSDEVLGFAEGEQGRDIQKIILDGFFRYAGNRLGEAVTAFGLPKSNGDIRLSLRGERTFLWDFPEFAPIRTGPDIVHVGPLSWNHWPYDTVDGTEINKGKEPLAVVAFGTCTVCLSSARRIMQVLLDLGYRILLAAGGQKEFLNILPPDPRITIRTFAPLHEILPAAALLVTHGGQLTVFEALQNKVPVVVMPFQPEQAHNGVCLERLGCGTRLIPPHPFQGNPQVYVDALERMTDDQIRTKISALVRDPELSKRLASVSAMLSRCGGVEALVSMLEER